MAKIVLVGAGSLQFGTGMLGDIFQSAVLAGSSVALNDINMGAAEPTLKVAKAHIAARGLTHNVSTEPDLRSAFAGADFVVISIEVGDRFALWDQDWKIPQQYGITQVFGENGGAGGLFHALRIILRIPGRSGHPYRWHPATHSDLIRPGIPVYPATPKFTWFKLLRGDL